MLVPNIAIRSRSPRVLETKFSTIMSQHEDYGESTGKWSPQQIKTYRQRKLDREKYARLTDIISGLPRDPDQEDWERYMEKAESSVSRQRETEDVPAVGILSKCWSQKLTESAVTSQFGGNCPDSGHSAEMGTDTRPNEFYARTGQGNTRHWNGSQFHLAEAGGKLPPESYACCSYHAPSHVRPQVRIKRMGGGDVDWEKQQTWNQLVLYRAP